MIISLYKKRKRNFALCLLLFLGLISPTASQAALQIANSSPLADLFEEIIENVQKDDYQKCIFLERKLRLIDQSPSIFKDLVQHMDCLHRLRLAIEEKGIANDYYTLFWERKWSEKETLINFYYLDIKYEIYKCVAKNNIDRLKTLIDFYGIASLKRLFILDESCLDTSSPVLWVKFSNKVCAAKKELNRLSLRPTKKWRTKVNPLLCDEGCPTPIATLISSFLPQPFDNQSITPQAAFDRLGEVTKANRFPFPVDPHFFDVRELEGFISLLSCEKPYLLFRAYYKNRLQTPQKVAHCFAQTIQRIGHSQIIMGKFTALVNALIEKEELFSLDEKVRLPNGRLLPFSDFLFEECLYKCPYANQELALLPFYIGQLAKNNPQKKIIKKNKNYLVKLYEVDPRYLENLFNLWKEEDNPIFKMKEACIRQKIMVDEEEKCQWEEKLEETERGLEEFVQFLPEKKVKNNSLEENDHKVEGLLRRIRRVRENYQALQALVPASGLRYTNAQGENIFDILEASDQSAYKKEEIMELYQKKAPQTYRASLYKKEKKMLRWMLFMPIAMLTPFLLLMASEKKKQVKLRKKMRNSKRKEDKAKKLLQK